MKVVVNNHRKFSHFFPINPYKDRKNRYIRHEFQAYLPKGMMISGMVSGSGCKNAPGYEKTSTFVEILNLLSINFLPEREQCETHELEVLHSEGYSHDRDT